MMTYFDTSEAASKLSLSISQMHKMRHFGTGPDFAKFGSAVRYSDKALEECLVRQNIRIEMSPEQFGRKRIRKETGIDIDADFR